LFFHIAFSQTPPPPLLPPPTPTSHLPPPSPLSPPYHHVKAAVLRDLCSHTKQNILYIIFYYKIYNTPATASDKTYNTIFLKYQVVLQ
jgi:hypothetical protein